LLFKVKRASLVSASNCCLDGGGRARRKNTISLTFSFFFFTFLLFLLVLLLSSPSRLYFITATGTILYGPLISVLGPGANVIKLFTPISYDFSS
jgi:hypothetical protein